MILYGVVDGWAVLYVVGALWTCEAEFAADAKDWIDVLMVCGTLCHRTVLNCDMVETVFCSRVQ